MKVAIFGETLYAGVMAAVWAETGHTVYWCLDKSNPQTAHYGLDEQLNQRLSRLHDKNSIIDVLLDDLPTDIDAYFFAFNSTEQDKVVHLVDYLALRAEVRPKLMINGCTFGLHGTAKLQQYASQDYWVYLPDMIQEGQAIQSFLQLKQVIIGVESDQAKTLILELLRPYYPLPEQFLLMPILDAEFAKLSISGMLATRISYMNDLSQVAEKLGIDILNVRQGLAADNRIGSVYLSAGAGFGGENFSNDILTLANTVLNTGVKSRLLEQVWQINEAQKEILFRKLWNYYQGDLKDKTIAIWGASFKENTARIEYSPTLVLLDALFAQGATVRLHDPQALPEIARHYGERADLILCQDAYDAIENADALCLMTAWKQYYSPDFKRLNQKMKYPLLLDGRNIYDPDFVRSQGVVYSGVGRI
ncbi:MULTISPECIES: UDP binding domain-containing protein [unclassified Acinetobacter]|uniref:UDP binding domain-containing protein n=1 Tax=unclassified Acinetobacter TaxID=196816 RepID=UPI0035B7E39C